MKKTVDQLKNRLATLKNLENYYDGFLQSDYKKKQLKKIGKEQHDIRTKLQAAGITPLY